MGVVNYKLGRIDHKAVNYCEERLSRVLDFVASVVSLNVTMVRKDAALAYPYSGLT